MFARVLHYKNVEILTEHKIIEDYFQKNNEFEKNGKFLPCRPTKSSIGNLSDSFVKAESMLLKSEKLRSPIIRNAFCGFMTEYRGLPKTLF